MEGKLITQKYIDAVTAWERKFTPYQTCEFHYRALNSDTVYGVFDYIYANFICARDAYEDALEHLAFALLVDADDGVLIPHGESHDSSTKGCLIDYDTWHQLQKFADAEYPKHWPGYDPRRVEFEENYVRIRPK